MDLIASSWFIYLSLLPVSQFGSDDLGVSVSSGPTDRHHLARPCAAELLFGPVEQHPQIVAIDTELSADVIVGALVEKESFEDVSVARRQFVDDAADALAFLAVHQGSLDVFGGGKFEVLVEERLGAVGATVLLEDDVVADGIDVGAELPRVAQAAAGRPQRLENAHKYFLPHVVNRLERGQTPAELDQQKLLKI